MNAAHTAARPLAACAATAPLARRPAAPSALLAAPAPRRTPCCFRQAALQPAWATSGSRRRAAAAPPRAEQQGGSGEVKRNTEFGYSRKDVILIGAGMIGAGYAMYYGLQATGMEPGIAGNWAQFIIFVGLCFGWVGSYLYRVATKQMTYVKQLEEYEEAVMRKRLEEMPDAEVERMLGEVEEEKQRRQTVQAHDRLFSRVLHGRLATEQDAKPDSFAAHVSAPAAPGAVQAISSPPENYAFHMEAAAQKNMYPLPKLVILGLLAGAYISMGYSLCSLVGGQLSKEFRMEQPGAFNFLFGIFGFPMGLTLCVVAGADLFTSNCMYATIAVAEGRYGVLGLLRCWLVSYFCNLLGSLIMVGLMMGGEVFYGTRKDFVIDLALSKTSHSFGVTFCKGILCNWLVCLAVWQGNMARDLTGKFVGIFLPNSAFVSMGFEHCVANMYLIPLSMALGSGISVGTFITKNLIPATLGNIVGGAGFVGIAYALSFGTPGHEVFEAWEHALACLPCAGRLAQQPALPSPSGIASSLPGLAAALQRLTVQQPSWEAAQAGGQRSFAAAAAGGSGSSEDGGIGQQQAGQEPQGADQLRSETGQHAFANAEEALEAWGKAMDQGDWSTAWDIFEGVLPVDTEEFPPLEDLLSYDAESEAREARRLHEEQLKEAAAARWVRRLDPVSGRAFGVGKRKTSVAQVWLKPGMGHLMVNKRPYDVYFPDLLRRNDIMAPFLATGTLGMWDVMVRVQGGGQTGQSQAVRHGIARALQNWEPKLRPLLKTEGLLTRDSRIVERKKPGLKKARKAFQWVKRRTVDAGRTSTCTQRFAGSPGAARMQACLSGFAGTALNARCPAQQRQPRRGPAPVRAAYAQIGHTDRTHESMNGPGSAYRPGGPGKKLPIAYSPEWIALREHTKEIEKLHLRDQLMDEERTDALIHEHNGLYVDFSRQNINETTMQLLLNLAERAKLRTKMNAMFAGEHINNTEDRAVLHTALRAPRDSEVFVDGKNVVPDVWDVLDKIRDFSERVRSGEWLGATGKPLTDVVAIGIGGSYLGPLFVHTAMQFDEQCKDLARGRKLRFLANVDPVDVAKAVNGLNPETTLVIVISKTFTTTETMLNARTVRTWLTAELGQEAVAKHMVAVSTNLKLVKEFGIDPENAFGFWDWVGGRYSVTSAVGILPLALQYGFEKCEEFLRGAHDIDVHWRDAPFQENIPVLMGLISIWNSTFLGRSSVAVLPYCQALSKFPSHIQQVAMESVGKQVSIDGEPLPFKAGEIYFGEPGTNGQHSFYQLIHQGRIVPCEFIGTIKSQQSVYLKGELVSNHDELMCNFFAQADALAIGKDSVTLRAENVPEYLIPHKTFSGNRPSTSLLLPSLSPFRVGQLLALYENRVATQGFIWNVNSFDQWGVELGKVLASRVRTMMHTARTRSRRITITDGFNPSTRKMINRYLDGKNQMLYPEPRDVFPCDLIHSEECEAKCFAGYRQGGVPLPTPPATRSVTDFSRPGGSDTQMLQDALAWAHAQPVDPNGYLVLTIPAGKFVLTEKLLIKRSRLVLRGAGMGATVLQIPKSLTDIYGPCKDTDWGGYVNAGAFISVSGKTQKGVQVAQITGAANRGDYTVTVNNAAFLTVGDIFDIWFTDINGRFNSIMFDGKQEPPPKFNGKTWTRFSPRVLQIVGNRVTLERPLPYTITPDAVRAAFYRRPATTEEVGVEGLTFSFKWELYAGHHLERGWGGVELMNGVRDCWVKDIELINPDNGVMINYMVTQATIRNIRIRYTAPRGNNIPNAHDQPADTDGHWGLVYSFAQDILFDGWDFVGNLQHDVGTGFAGQLGVFMNGRSSDGNLDLHRGLAGPTLYTNINVGKGSKALVSGGPKAAGPNTLAFSTWWGIATGQPAAPNKSDKKAGNCAFGPSINLVGLTLSSTTGMCPSWWYEPAPIAPANLYAAQLARRLAARSSSTCAMASRAPGLDSLPDDLLGACLGFLSPADGRHVTAVNKRMRRIFFEQPSIWRNLQLAPMPSREQLEAKLALLRHVAPLVSAFAVTPTLWQGSSWNLNGGGGHPPLAAFLHLLPPSLTALALGTRDRPLELPPGTVQLLQPFTALRSLSLHGLLEADGLPAVLLGMQHLQQLDCKMERCPDVRQLTQLTQLSQLQLRDSGGSGLEPPALTACPQLEHFELESFSRE
ncbi:cytosolic phosphoglucose isomerase isoform A [Chlorella sorokiniana]|uniref:Glucose-6-phosphate isomerase n=1 Tax=Chlorella sorokiniana TaxID=3076 RepID=A0A2P6TB73_CHLSO|nr:cytosolic phosphoglucose isomerase isoform A [Chlorella sorokiniana]|eukprot:PRW05792.1 cytosolic phosphoglucose isomerase isoform A [Chlorella sorokiniana]